MSPRPEPMKSQFAGRSASRPEPATAPEQPQPPAVEDRGEGRSKRKQMGIQISEEEQSIIRGAYFATLSQERHGSLSNWIVSTMLREVERLEEKYQPPGGHFEPISAGEIPSGRNAASLPVK